MTETAVTYKVSYQGLSVDELAKLQEQWLIEYDALARRLALVPQYFGEEAFINGKTYKVFTHAHVHISTWEYAQEYNPAANDFDWYTGLIISLNANYLKNPVRATLVACIFWPKYKKQNFVTNVFVPGKWIESVERFAGEAYELDFQKKQAAIEHQRQELIKRLLLDAEV
jgi:hypothetical protein